MLPTATFNQTEQEVIVLRAVWDMIDGMVNYENFAKGHSTVEAEMIFNTRTHQRLFNILLVDFLSKPPKGTFDLPEPKGSAKQTTRISFLFAAFATIQNLTRKVKLCGRRSRRLSTG